MESRQLEVGRNGLKTDGDIQAALEALQRIMLPPLMTVRVSAKGRDSLERG
jgi:hypothetical protein